MSNWTDDMIAHGESHDAPGDSNSNGLWTRRNALAVTAGFFALGAAPARASAFLQSPQPRATQIVVSKSKRVLELRNGQDVLKRYRVNLGFEPEGPKLRSGDGRTPEGQYIIDRRNPRSDFYLSLGVSYPNATDLARAAAMGVSPGGDIYVHGGPTRAADRGKRDWTAGCIAVSDSEIEEIWSMVPTGVPIIIMA